MLTTGVVFLIHMPCGHWISLEAWGRSFRPCVPASLAGDHGDGPDSCRNTWSDKMSCRGFGAAYCAPVPFSALLLITKKAKNSGTESLLCAAVCFIHCIKPYMLSALLPCLSERQTTYPAGAIMIRIKMLISSFTSDGAKPCSIVMRLFAKCTRMGNSRFLFFS